MLNSLLRPFLSVSLLTALSVSQPSAFAELIINGQTLPNMVTYQNTQTVQNEPKEQNEQSENIESKAYENEAMSKPVTQFINEPVTKTVTNIGTNIGTNTVSKPIANNIKADWTPLLKTMQNGCDLPDFDNLSPQMTSSIVTNNLDKHGKTMGDYKVLTLKNAFAWGYPIKKIQYGSAGAGFSSATVYFTSRQFLALRPKFYIQTASGRLRASDKTIITDRNAFAGQYLANGMGYNDGRVGVNFSKKTNSITCSWAHLTS